jgi:NADH-quinone oxidoreductase subunit F
MVWVASKITKFFKHESCGKCTPCREGTYWLDKVIDRILRGEGKPNDVELIENIARNMQGVTLCALGDFAANPIIYTIKNFPDDFKAYVDPELKKAKEIVPVAQKPAGRTSRRAAAAPATGD